MKAKIKSKLKKAENEVDGAVMAGDEEQSLYWLGRKDAFKWMLREMENE